MLIRRLEFSGIGPFAKRHVIDWDALAEPGIFLIEGPTGSGKSTIIDAIVFALYGSVAGKDSSGERMRSSHAQPTEDSWVDLIFTVESGTYRVRRRPAYQRAKKRGAGVTEVAASAKLWKLSESALVAGKFDVGEPLATQARETSEMLANIVGLNKSQFVQTVVLPQGQFADFLRLNSDKRTKLLEKIFHTDSYRAFAEELRALGAQAEKDTAKAQTKFGSALDQWLANAGIAAADREKVETLRAAALAEQAHVDAQSTTAPIAAAIAAANKRLKSAAATAAEKLVQAQEQAAKNYAALKTGEELAARLNRRAKLLAQQEKLSQQREELSSEISRSPLPSQVRVPITTTAVAGRIGDSLSEMIGEAQRAAELAAAVAQRRETIAAGEVQQAELTAGISADRATLAELPEQEANARAALQAAQTAAEQSEMLDMQRKRVTALQEVAAQQEQAEAEAAAAMLQAATARKTYTEATERARVLTAQWVASSAALLADELTAGQPCPVCGSVTHPQPAAHTEAYTPWEEVEQAQQAATAAGGALNEAQEKLAAARATADSLTQQLAGNTAPELAQQVLALTEQIAKARAAAQRVQVLTAKIAELDQQREELARKISQAEQEQAAITAAAKEARSYIAEQEKAIAKATGEFASITAKIAVLAELRRKLTEWKEQMATVAAQLAEPAVAQLTGTEQVDVAALQAAHESARNAQEEAAGAAARAQQFAADAKRLAEPVRSAAKGWQDAVSKAAPIRRLASLATAGAASTTGIALDTWALLKRFEVVVDRANEYLARISGGRYELKRIDESSHGRKAGLDLRVIDRQGSPRGDEERETTSLSGGETFYTSLALALALAQVVQEEQGGIQIDTLLIDEGFGTLSDEVREAVMQTLTALTNGGRKVGIVSHVEELKQMVPNRISMRRLADGSSTLSVTA